jgi:hypothetical protein
LDTTEETCDAQPTRTEHRPAVRDRGRRLRSLRTELDRLDDAIELLDRDDRPRLGHPSAIVRDILDMIEEDDEARAAGR